MTNPSSGKVVLITGATDGLGKAAAILLAERGYRVYAAGRSPEKRAQLDQLAQTRNLPLATIELDVCSDDSVRAAVQHVLSEASQRLSPVLVREAAIPTVISLSNTLLRNLGHLVDWQSLDQNLQSIHSL